jgi:hypothetical protein
MTGTRLCRGLSLAALLLLCAARGAAQVAPSGPWRTLHSQHFRIHFRPAYRAVAVDAAREAERAYALLAAELHPPRGAIDLTLADDSDVPNGFASTSPSNRITVLLPPPVADPGLQDYDAWLRLVIVHELTHVFHLDRALGLWRGLQSVFGRAPGLFPNEYQPSWVVEGLATYYESRFTAAGRADGTFHRELVAADAAAGRARSPWDALYFTRWPGGLAPYAYGSRFFDHVARTAGDSVVPRFMERTARQLIPFRVGRQLRLAGAPRPLAEDWALAIARAVPADTAAAGKRLIGGLRSAPVPRVAPDGRRVAYLYDDGRDMRRLRIAEVPAWRTLRSHAVTGQVSYDWLGDTLVVAQLEFGDRWRLRSDLWRWMPDGAWRRATRGARRIQPRAGGRVLAVLTLSPDDDAPVLAGAPQPPDPPGTTWGAVAPSPDERWVAATRHRDGRWALVRWPAAAPESVTVLAEPSGVVSDPAWTADGGLLYVAEVAGFPQVHRWDEGTEGGGRRVTAEPRGARAPAALADGTLLFTTLAADGWELRAAAPLDLPGAVSAGPAALDSAPAVETRETGYAALPSLRPHFWIPVVLDVDAAGTFFGGVTGGIDALGRYAYLAEGLLTTTPLRAHGGVAVLTHVLGNPTLDFTASSYWDDIGRTGAGREVLLDDLDAALGATFVARRWRGFTSLRLAAEYEGKRFAVAPDTTVTVLCALCLPQDLVGGSLRVAVGHVVTAPLAVSSVRGFVANLLYRRREEQGGDRWSNELRGRLALYARAPPRFGFGHSLLAVRLAAGVIHGPLSQVFAVGGVSSGALDVGLGQSLGGTRIFPVRGYRGGELYGSRAATIAVEYRLPLALVGESLGHLPLGVDRFSLALFGDAGDAWGPGQAGQLLRLRSAGVELVGDLTVSYDLPLRVRVGIAQPADRSARVYAAFATDF